LLVITTCRCSRRNRPQHHSHTRFRRSLTLLLSGRCLLLRLLRRRLRLLPPLHHSSLAFRLLLLASDIELHPCKINGYIRCQVTNPTDNTQRTILSGQYSTDNTQRTILNGQYSMDNTQRTPTLTRLAAILRISFRRLLRPAQPRHRRSPLGTDAC
jgi:hypothetical protein